MILMFYRLEQSVNEKSNLSRLEPVLTNPGSNGNTVELENFLSTSSSKVGLLYHLFPLFLVKKYSMHMIDIFLDIVHVIKL